MDNELIKEEIFQDVYKRQYHFVLMISYSLLRNIGDSEDVLQDVFMKYLENSPFFENEFAEKAWFYKITFNLSISELRKLKRKNKLNDDLIKNLSIFQFDKGDDDIRHHIFNLPKKYKEVIILYYYEKLSVKEIAIILEKSELAIRKRLERARNDLKKLLEE